MAKSNKIIIQVCLCGAGTKKAQAPTVPYTAEELAYLAYAENNGYYQQDRNDAAHISYSPISAHRTKSTGMSNSSVSRWGSIWKS